MPVLSNVPHRSATGDTVDERLPLISPARCRRGLRPNSRLLHWQARMDRAAVTERRELRREGRHRDLGEGLGCPSALTVYHADWAHMAIE